MGPILSARSVSKVFSSPGRPPTVAVVDLDLDVARGEFVVLVGASGCGKTTLLRLFAGLERSTRGELLLADQPICGPSSEAALVFQSAVLLPWRTVLQNVMLPAEIVGLKGREIRERACSLLQMTGLSDFSDHYPRELSGGMRQRVAICRALILDPSILFMDEPFGALDAITRGILNREIYETWKRTNKTIVFVTHDITEAVRVASRIVVMTPRPGRIAYVQEVELGGQTYDERINSPQFLECLRDLQREVDRSIPANAVEVKKTDSAPDDQRSRPIAI